MYACSDAPQPAAPDIEVGKHVRYAQSICLTGSLDPNFSARMPGAFP